jgi:Hypoxia induced protein conserved region
MRTFFLFIIGGLMLATLGVLLAGVFTMTQTDHDPHRSNRLMRWRVILQGAVLLLFMALMSMLRP